MQSWVCSLDILVNRSIEHHMAAVGWPREQRVDHCPSSAPGASRDELILTVVIYLYLIITVHKCPPTETS